MRVAVPSIYMYLARKNAQLSIHYGLLWGIVAHSLMPLGFPGMAHVGRIARFDHSSKRCPGGLPGLLRRLSVPLGSLRPVPKGSVIPAAALTEARWTCEPPAACHVQSLDHCL